MTNKKTVTFIHTADWHIGHPFSLFNREMRKELKRTIFRSVELIFRYAQKMEIPLILCAGDLVDNGRLCPKEDVIKLFGIIEKYPGIRLATVTGNGDPLANRDVYSLIKRENFPGNFYLVEGEEELAFPEWNINIYAASMREKNGSDNPLNWIKETSLDKGKMNVALCHGNIEPPRNRDEPANDSPAPAFPVAGDLAEKNGLDYLALGGLHSFKKINERTYYPGVPEPLQFGDEGFPLKVKIAGPGSIPEVEPIENMRHYRWTRLEETVTPESFDEFKIKLETVGEKEIRELTVFGSLPIEKYKTYRELLAVNRHRCFEIHDHVTIQPGDPGFIESADNYIAAVVRRLMELKKSGQPLPEELLNPYVSVERTAVHRQANELKSNREKVIDNALLKIYSYLTENGT